MFHWMIKVLDREGRTIAERRVVGTMDAADVQAEWLMGIIKGAYEARLCRIPSHWVAEGL